MAEPKKKIIEAFLPSEDSDLIPSEENFPNSPFHEDHDLPSIAPAPKRRRLKKNKKRAKPQSTFNKENLMTTLQHLQNIKEENPPLLLPPPSVSSYQPNPGDGDLIRQNGDNPVVGWRYYPLPPNPNLCSIIDWEHSSCDEREEEYVKNFMNDKGKEEDSKPSSIPLSTPSSDERDSGSYKPASISPSPYDDEDETTLLHKIQSLHTTTPPPQAPSQPFVPYKHVYKPCFGCSWAHTLKTDNQAVSRLFKMLKEQFGSRNIIDLCRDAHLYFLQNIYFPFKERGKKPLWIWRTVEIYQHLMDPSHSLDPKLVFVREIHYQLQRLEFLKTREFKEVVYKDGTRVITQDHKTSQEIRDTYSTVQRLYNQRITPTGSLAIITFTV